MVMPRLDNNRALFDIRPVERVSYAGVLTCDPFGTADNFLRRLADHGYVGVSNWPSAILFQGHTKRMMASMPATPELEYAWLAGAQRHGFQSLAFFRSLEQGRAALSAGLRQLVLHPGLIPQTTGGPPDLLIASLGDLIEKLRHQVDGVEILLYEHVGLNEAVQATDVGADGALIFKATP
ncbi:Phosphoenolpyruvate hydrolase-like [Shimia sagamensis]|uniref:Phosphoenolpyruvate hydrolase-like n=2 Tax=Shimia sagamensis TaxID=1566352 RepID=A0ABY1PLS5_9RHOB|nr:Phosphoenolpyruvate hydrolase-like [Shimia sagamensis]